MAQCSLYSDRDNLRVNGDSNMTEANKHIDNNKACPKGLNRRLIGGLLALAAGVLMTTGSPVLAQSAGTTEASADQANTSTKIGFVNTQRILSDSGPAKAAQEKLEAEFNKRDDELQKAINDFRQRVQQFERDAPVLAESDRNRRQRELGNLDADLQRKQREIQEDFNRRRNEEFAEIIERANEAILEIADRENYDLILQDAVTVSDRVDITDKVIQALEKR